MPPPPGQSASPAYRILQGETISVIVWSSVAVTLASSWRIQYDDGSDDRISTDAFTTGSARAAQYMLSNQIARLDGYVTEGVVMFEGAAAAQRGQVYVQALVIMNPDTPTTTREVISAGYAYAGHAPTLGEVIEPGPAGGPGAIYIVTGANPAAGSLPSDTQPTGTIWRLLAYQVPLVTDNTVGNRAFLLTANSGTYRFLHINNNTQAASLTRGWAWLPGTDLSTTVGGSFVDGASTFLASYTLDLKEFTLGGMLYELLDSGTLAHTAGDDFGAPSLTVEEWVMPN